MRRVGENDSVITILVAESCEINCELLATALQRHRLSVVATGARFCRDFWLQYWGKIPMCAS